MTSYETIFKRFLGKITDFALAERLEYNPEIAIEDMTGWLHSTVVKIDMDQTVTFDDDNQVIKEDLSDWQIEIYALGMRVEWLQQFIEHPANLKQVFSSSEEKFYSQAQHLTTLMALQTSDKLAIRKLIRDYDYHHNSYIDGDS